MSIKALLATLVLGSSSVALAAPTATVNVRGNSGMVVRDHRPIDVDGWWFRNHRHPRPKPPVRYYAEPTVQYTYSPTYYPGYELPPAPVASQVMAPEALLSRVQVPVQANELEGKTTLRISASGAGSTYLQEIALYTRSNAVQTVAPQMSLSASNPYYDIPIASCSDLSGIVIDGQSMFGGSISITAF